MIKLERTSVMNLENAMRGARNPMNSWNRMDSFYDEDGNYVLGPNDLGLAKRLRRAGSDHDEKEKAKTIEVGDLRMDCEGRRVFIAGKEINLTAKEFDVLELLVFNPNKVYSRENLLNIVWGYEYPGDVRTVDVHIRRLREKIETNPSEPKYVHTKWGVGYYFQAQ